MPSVCDYIKNTILLKLTASDKPKVTKGEQKNITRVRDSTNRIESHHRERKM